MKSSKTEAYAPVSTDSGPHRATSNKAFLGLCLATLGVVYGDIGTSPLYAMSEIFFGHGGLDNSRHAAIGATSVVVWMLTIVICVKYMVFVLRADNHGEGGVFALLGLLGRGPKVPLGIAGLMLVLAAGLLVGEGIITPAISVLSAVEGLRLAYDGIEVMIVPITIVILVGLFAIQRRGTDRVGKVFGPIVMVWFAAIAVLGVRSVLANPGILQALNPIEAMIFVREREMHELLAVMGSVILVVTGGEALYADMGHFGRRPIRASWFTIVYPSLILSYLGQGAWVYGQRPVEHNNLFYSMVPESVLLPMIFLATAATIIASQALISGAFSLTRQAIALGLFPRVRIVHTSEEHEGQVYLPLVNWSLAAGCIALVIGFKSSSSLAAAYGFAVSAVMVSSTIGVASVASKLWKWSPLKVLAIFLPILLIDLSALTATSTKFVKGGYVPMILGFILLGVMTTWRWGRSLTARGLAHLTADDSTVENLIEAKKRTIALPRSVVVMTSRPMEKPTDAIPAALQSFWDRFGALPKHIIFMTVSQEPVPRVPPDKRLEVVEFTRHDAHGSIAAVRIHAGYLDEPNVQAALKAAKRFHHIKIPSEPSKWLVVVGQENLVGHPAGVLSLPRLKFYNLMLRNSVPAHAYLGLGTLAGVTTETMMLRCNEHTGDVTVG